MNIERRDDAGFRALVENGFLAPDLGPTTLVGDRHYDQIAFSGRGEMTRMLTHGVIRWHDAVYRDDEASAYEAIARAIRGGAPYGDWPREYPTWRTHEMSDHLPIWIELETDYSDDYLRSIV